jgi:hypothetical protein
MLYVQWCWEFPNGPLDPNCPTTRQLWCRTTGFPDPVIPKPGNLADMPTEGSA